ncbi:MAG TPA: alanine racemase [Solirubrobacteraceae bacterium]|jgi:alanine racemase
MRSGRAAARVDTGAIARNCARLRGELAEGVELCAVVKADGYGHGAFQSATGALAGGASWLAVASLPEALELVDERLAARVLVLGPLRGNEVREAGLLGVDIVVWEEPFVAHLSELAEETGRPARVHVKLDTGMGRLGVRDPECAMKVVEAAVAAPGVELAGVMTHFATADELGDPFFDEQLQRFAAWTQVVKQAHPGVIAHAANSAALLRTPAAHFDMVRCGIAIYGMDPFGEGPAERDLEPALELSSYIAAVKLCRAGESSGYGRRFMASSDTHLGLLPIGYGDGWRRALTNNAEVLVGGRRYPLVGTVSMDSVVVDLGPDPTALELAQAPAILIGAQDGERITAEELARRIDTINYEITCGLTARVARVYGEEDEALAASEEDEYDEGMFLV